MAMTVKLVEEIDWDGGLLDSYAIVRHTNLGIDSIVEAPSLHLIKQSQADRAITSVKSMAHDLKNFFEDLESRNINWQDVTDNQMSRYIKEGLQLKKGMSDISIERNISSLRTFYESAYEIGQTTIKKSFTFAYKKDQHAPKAASYKKANFDLFNKYTHRSIFNSLLSSVVVKNPFERERDELALTLGIDCGLRSAEVTDYRNLRTDRLKKILAAAENIFSYAIIIPIIGKGDKLRHIDVPPKAAMKIKNFLYGRRSNLPEGSLICKRNGDTLGKYHCTNIFRRAKLSATAQIGEVIDQLHLRDPSSHFITKSSFKNLTFHSLRHTYATNLVDFCYKNGLDPNNYIPEQMGHSDPSTTEIYIIFDGKLHQREIIRNALNAQQSVTEE